MRSRSPTERGTFEETRTRYHVNDILVQSSRLQYATITEMDMGWVHPWAGLGWVGSHFPAHVVGWVE